MKKAISVSFLLLANIVLLAHAVVPHHYHGQVPVISCDFQHEQNDDTNDHNDCLLSKVYLRFGGDKQLLPFIDVNAELFFCLLPVFSDGFSNLETLPFRYKPYLQFLYLAQISQSLGLRAPPAC
jgi:hypothetical protein